MGCVLSLSTYSSEDRVNDLPMPPAPPSVCEGCWQGHFAKQLGLPLVSPQDGQLYRPWPEGVSYLTSKAVLQSRADAGCVWCRLVLGVVPNVVPHLENFIVNVVGTTEKYDELHPNLQRLFLEVVRAGLPGVKERVYEAFVYAAPGTSGY